MKNNSEKYKIDFEQKLSDGESEKKSSENIKREAALFFSELDKQKNDKNISMNSRLNEENKIKRDSSDISKHKRTNHENSNQSLILQKLAEKITASATLASALSSLFDITLEQPTKTVSSCESIKNPSIMMMDVSNSDSEKSLETILSEKGYVVSHSDKSPSLLEKSVMIAGKIIESVGRDEDSAIESLEESQNKAKEENETIISENNHLSSGEGNNPTDKIKTAIDDKVIDTIKQNLPEDIVKTFKDGCYRTVETIEDIILYRVYGNAANKQGCYLTTQIPRDRMDTKISSAILAEWKNSRKYYCEVEVPKGTILNIGKVAEQKTASDNLLDGEADQILVSLTFASNSNYYKEERSLNFTSNYLEFEDKVKKTENK